MELLEYLERKVCGVSEVREFLDLVVSSLARDVEPVFIRGLSRVRRVVLARAFTKYGWLLAIYGALGMVEGDELIIYYNEEPRWVASTLIHEVTHLALGIERRDVLDVVADEALAYVATFKSGFKDLYVKGVKQFVKLLSNCINPYYDHELVGIVVPRVLAIRLVSYDFRYLVNEVLKDSKAVLKLWLRTEPREEELIAMSTALSSIGVGEEVLSNLINLRCKEVIKLSSIANKYSYELEGVDEDFKKMVELLNKATEEGRNVREVLKPWWGSLEGIREYVEAYIWIRKSTTSLSN